MSSPALSLVYDNPEIETSKRTSILSSRSVDPWLEEFALGGMMQNWESPSENVGVPTHQIEKLVSDLRLANQRISVLEKILTDFVSQSASQMPEPRQLDDAEAKFEIKAHFETHDGESIDADDIARALNIDLGVSMRLLEEMCEEGLIA